MWQQSEEPFPSLRTFTSVTRGSDGRWTYWPAVRGRFVLLLKRRWLSRHADDDGKAALLDGVSHDVSKLKKQIKNGGSQKQKLVLKI